MRGEREREYDEERKEKGQEKSRLDERLIKGEGKREMRSKEVVEGEGRGGKGGGLTQKNPKKVCF